MGNYVISIAHYREQLFLQLFQHFRGVTSSRVIWFSLLSFLLLSVSLFLSVVISCVSNLLMEFRSCKLQFILTPCLQCIYFYQCKGIFFQFMFLFFLSNTPCYLAVRVEYLIWKRSENMMVLYNSGVRGEKIFDFTAYSAKWLCPSP